MRPKVIPEGGKWCPRCERVKPLDDFYRVRATDAPRGRCKACETATTLEWQHSAAGLAWRAGYLARPDVAARRKAADAARGPRPYRPGGSRATPRGKLLHYRGTVGSRLAHTTDPHMRARLEARLAALELDLYRLGWEPRSEKGVG